VIQGDQENGHVVLLRDGGAFFAWQGGTLGFQHIFARVMGPGGTFLTGDIPVSSGAGEHQIDPVLAVLADGDVVVVWSSYRQDGPNYDVFGRIFSPTGEARGPEFRVNQVIDLGRRTPAVAGLANGGFVVVWAGDRIIGQRHDHDALGRRIVGTGAPL